MPDLVGFFIFDDIIEIGIVVVVVVIVGIYFLLKSAFNSASSSTTTMAGTTAGAWSQSPAAIPASPATGSFKYHVDFTPSGGTRINLAGRSVSFVLRIVTSGSGQISDLTDNAGTRTVNAMAATGVTDAYGDIVLLVALERGETAELVATDDKTGTADPPISFQAQ